MTDITQEEYDNMVQRTAEITFDELYKTDESVYSSHFEDELMEDARRAADNHGWINNPSCSLSILKYGSDPMEWKHYVTDDDDYQAVLDAMAYVAFRQDVQGKTREILEQHRDVDVTVRSVYDNALDSVNETEWDYAGYTFVKVNSSHSNHSEIALLNGDGRKIESYTIGAFDSVLDFNEKVMDLMDYGPDSMQDWLDYRREQRE